MPDVRGEIERGAAPAHRVEVLGERLEVPHHAGHECGGDHVLDVLERAHDVAVVLLRSRPARSRSRSCAPTTVVTRAVIGRGPQRRVPEHLRVVMGVDVDEAGRDRAAGRRRAHDHRGGSARSRVITSAVNGHVGGHTGSTTAVVDGAAANHDVSRHRRASVPIHHELHEVAVGVAQVHARGIRAAAATAVRLDPPRSVAPSAATAASSASRPPSQTKQRSPQGGLAARRPQREALVALPELRGGES